jgi:IPT/TIG domain-containing protein
VTLGGPNLGTVTAVAFGNVSTTSITVLSATSIRVAVPAGAVTARLTATNPAGSAQSAATFVLAPKLTGFNVASGADDDAVSLLGSGLAGTTLVKFGTVSAVFTVVSEVEISAIVPAAAVTGRVSVTTPGGTATSPADFIVTAPGPS